MEVKNYPRFTDKDAEAQMPKGLGQGDGSRPLSPRPHPAGSRSSWASSLLRSLLILKPAQGRPGSPSWCVSQRKQVFLFPSSDPGSPFFSQW